ncbi:MAG: hypothetical protein ACI4D5_03800, partial [Kineothrix sp.]
LEHTVHTRSVGGSNPFLAIMRLLRDQEFFFNRKKKISADVSYYPVKILGNSIVNISGMVEQQPVKRYLVRLS